MSREIAVVVPTIREECLSRFFKAWEEQFQRHNVEIVVVHDGESPLIRQWHFGVRDVPERYLDIFFNFNDGIRNLGFAFVAKQLRDVKYIITLDDDTEPCGDTIGDHVRALKRKVPISWMGTATLPMRGFPYGVREEADVWVSHGVWQGVPDYDAPTQLVYGIQRVTYPALAVPKGALIPVCGMNLAFRREALPYMYFAPMGPRVGVHRFADIWMGIRMKRELDRLGKALVTGYATVNHNRASNVFKNLEQEAKGIRLNETYWQGDESDPYFKTYNECYELWKEFIG